MRSLGVVLVAVAVVWPPGVRGLRPVVGAIGGAALVWSTWDESLSEASRAWAAALVVLAAMAIAAGAGPLQRRLATPGVAWLVLGAAAAAIYGCVPETGQMAEVGVLLACGGVAELVRRRAVPAPLVAAGAAVVLWSGVYGAAGRQSALIGALFAVAATLWVPVACRLWRSLGAAGEPWRWAVAALAAGGSLGMSRTGGIEPTTRPAVLAALAWGVLLVAATWMVAAVAASSGEGQHHQHERAVEGGDGADGPREE